MFFPITLAAEEQDRGKMDHGYLNPAFEEEQENYQTHQVQNILFARITLKDQCTYMYKIQKAA